jgi:hypothetical protein
MDLLLQAVHYIQARAILRSPNGTGIYTLTSDDFSASTVVVATPTAVNIQVGAGIGASSNELQIFVRNSNTGALADAFFNFVAFTF